MREFKMSNGKVVSIRPLTFREVQTLREKTLDLNSEILEFAKLQKVDEKEILDLPMPEAIAFQRCVADETFPNKDEVKN